MTRVEKVFHAGALALALVVLTAACAPGVSSPVGRDDSRVCKWVRESVHSGAMPLPMAEDFYPWCGPFEVPS